MKVVTAAEMREIDRVAIEERGIAGAELMERAGSAIGEAVTHEIEPGPVLLLCGRGNNGGDGFVAARYLAHSGYTVYIIPVMGTEELSADARQAFEGLPREKLKVIDLPDEEGFRLLLEDMDAVVDAMLGTGAKPPLRDPMSWIVRAVNDSGLPVIAADLPTGLDADSGTGNDVMRARRTVTIGLPKVGMLTPNGLRHCGAVVVEPAQFPRDLLQNPKLWHNTMLPSEAAALLPARPPDAHKGTLGLVAVCAGSVDMPGAASICAQAALRSGVGLVRLHVPREVRPIVAPQVPEALLSPTGGVESEVLAPLSAGDWISLVSKATAFVVGPGMTDGLKPRRFLDQVLREFAGPVVLDADALNLLAAHKGLRKGVEGRGVLTPHPGEMARLLGREVAEVQSDRWQTAAEAAAAFGCVVVFKGFGALVATPEGQVTHVPTGNNSALARGGSGDMLAGLIGGLLAQGMLPAEASILGAYVGGLAADMLLREKSPRGLLLREILSTLPAAWRELERLAHEAASPQQRNSGFP